MTQTSPAAVAERTTDRLFYTPFNLKYDQMERLLLINFEGDPDTTYIGFEPQVFDDPVKGHGLLVIGWRRDGRIDVYHQPSLTLKRADYDIVAKGLAEFAERPFAGARFEIGPRGLDLDLAFEDVTGRPVTLRIHEQNPRRRKPFGLLAPFPSSSTQAPALPLALLHDFYFVRRAQTEIAITIAGRSHQPDTLPAPIDGARMYFTRYSPDPFVVLWNENHDGPLNGHAWDGGGTLEADGVRYDLHDAGDGLAIRAMRAGSDRHTVAFTFDPPFPHLPGLRDGERRAGTFSIDLEPCIGRIDGTYTVARAGDRAEITIHPSGGWHPRVTKLSLWIMFRAVAIFKAWPKTYQWRATVDLGAPDGPHMRSGWSRL